MTNLSDWGRSAVLKKLYSSANGMTSKVRQTNQATEMTVTLK